MTEDATAARALRKASELFASGRFEEAAAIYQQLHAKLRGDPQSMLREAQLALLDNRLDLAEARARAVLAAQPANPVAKRTLAEALYRSGAFAEAAIHIAELGRPAFAQILASIGAHAPYAHAPVVAPVTQPWRCAEPLPVVAVSVNGVEANLILDTGAGELTLDASFAATAGVRLGLIERGSFAAGQRAELQHAWVEELTLGSVRVAHLPAQCLDLQPVFAPFFPGLRIDGVLGTAVFRLFRTELDYKAAELRLRGCDAQSSFGGERFWLAGTHHIVAQGRIDDAPPGLMFLDSGMSGTAFAASRATVRALNVRLNRLDTHTGYGGGGQVESVSFRVGQLCFAGTCRNDVRGLVLAQLPIGHEFGFSIRAVIADQFLRETILTLDFAGMRMSLT